MANAYFEDHPTDPDKVILRKPKYEDYKREWVGLTATTILNMMPSTIPADYDGELMEFARAVEAKLKEKNHG